MWAAEPSVIHTPTEPSSEVGCCCEELETDLPHCHSLCPWVSLAMLEVVVKRPRLEESSEVAPGAPLRVPGEKGEEPRSRELWGDATFAPQERGVGARPASRKLHTWIFNSVK